MDPFAARRKRGEADLHPASEITLLCKNHHGEAGSTLPDRTIRAADANPFCVRNQRSIPRRLWYDRVSVHLGSCSINLDRRDDSFVFVAIDCAPIIQGNWEKGQLLLDVMLYDFNDRLAVSIVENELSYLADTFDVEWVGKKLTIRSSPGSIDLDLLIDPERSLFKIESGKFQYAGYSVVVRRDGVVETGAGKEFSEIRADGMHGFWFGEPEPPSDIMAIHFDAPATRYWWRASPSPTRSRP